MIYRKFLSRGLVAALFSLMIGCGSSGLGEVIVSPANAQQLASQTADAGGFLMQMSDMAEGFSSAIETPAQTIPCDSGNAQLVVNDVAPQGVLSTGDTMTMNFNGCVIGGITMNGSVSLTAAEVIGSEGGPFSLQLLASFNSFTFLAGGGTAVVNGGFQLDVSSDDGVTVVAVVSGNYLSAFAQGGGETFSGTLKDFRLEREENGETGDYVVDMDMTVSGSGLGGEVVVETLVPFTGNGESEPSAGSSKVTGALGGSVTLVALNDVDVELYIDLDGDGESDLGPIATTWADLD